MISFTICVWNIALHCYFQNIYIFSLHSCVWAKFVHLRLVSETQIYSCNYYRICPLIIYVNISLITVKPKVTSTYVSTLFTVDSEITFLPHTFAKHIRYSYFNLYRRILTISIFFLCIIVSQELINLENVNQS